MRAVEKVVARALDPAKRRGLVWHTQGSGKTLTMISVAAQLLRAPEADELRWAARHWAGRIGVKLARVQVREMRSKSASISTAGRLTLNSDLLAVPKPLGEFVIVHELVHRLAPNHGKVFKSFMHAYLPDWQQRERALQKHARGTTFPRPPAAHISMPARNGAGTPRRGG